MFELTLDPVAKILRLETTGYLTVDDVQDYRRRLARMVDESRRRFGHVRILVDSTDGRVQSAAVIDAFGAVPSVVTGSGDRMAVAVGSTLALLQVRRALKSEQEHAFLSMDAALTWLTAN